MINGQDFYAIMTAMVPLYFAMFLSYASVKWWKIFTPDQCSGINRFVAIYIVPLLSFRFIYKNNPYTMNFRFLAADTLQKIIMLAVLGLWVNFTKTGSFEWLITFFSLSTIPNTFVIGIPLLGAMYGDFSASLMVQTVVMQFIFWFTLLIFFYEFRGAKLLIMEKFPESGGDIVSIKVDSDVVSLDGHDFLETIADIGDDGKLHVTVRKSNVSRRFTEVGSISGAEIYSLNSSFIQTPRVSNFGQSGCYSITGIPSGRLSSFGPARVSHYEDDPMGSSRSRLNQAAQNMTKDLPPISLESTKVQIPTQTPIRSKPQLQQSGWQNKVVNDVQLSSRSTSAPITSKWGHTNLRARSDHSSRTEQNGAKEILMPVCDHTQNGKTRGAEMEVFESEISGEKTSIKEGSDSTSDHHPDTEAVLSDVHVKQLPPMGVMTRLITKMVWRKLIRNPSTYSSIAGLIWSLVSFRWQLELPKIIEDSITLISDGGLGMAMFSVGLFTALQPKMIACGWPKAMLATVAKFLIGPMVMVIAAVIVGLHGTVLQISIVQATISSSMVPFVYAKEYNVHPTIHSSGLILGMLITVPVNLCYSVILELLS